MEELRRRTLAAHQRIEQTPLFSAPFSEDYTLAGYFGLLTALRGFYASAEEILFAGLPDRISLAMAHRRKTPLLDRDLQALEWTAMAETRHAILSPHARNWSAARKMGGLYVLEGATLGGRLIKRRLSSHFGNRVNNALAFYGVYGNRAGAEWGSFRALMRCEYDNDPLRIDEAVDGASDIFQALQDWADEHSSLYFSSFLPRHN